MGKLLIALSMLVSLSSFADEVAKCSIYSSGKEVLSTKISSNKPVSRNFVLNSRKYIIQSGRFIDGSLDVWVKSESPSKEIVGRYEQEIVLSLHEDLLMGQKLEVESEPENLILECIN